MSDDTVEENEKYSTIGYFTNTESTYPHTGHQNYYVVGCDQVPDIY